MSGATGVGIIGCGQIAKFHYEGYAKAGAKIAHVCDVRAEQADLVARQYGARASTDYRAVLDDPAVKLVSVLTPASTHREICIAALQAGKGVVCEKTLADTPAAAAAIAREADATGRFCATAYMKRSFPAALKAKELLGSMGPIISIYARSWQPWDLWSGPVPEAFLTHPSGVVRAYGGGVLVCAGSHVLDLTHWFGGRANRISGQMNIRQGMDFDNQANAMMWLENGGMVHFEACWHPLRRGGRLGDGWDERFEINAEKGRLDFYTVYWNRPVTPALLVHQDAETGTVTEYRYDVVNPFDAEMAEMVRRFEAGEKAMPSAWDGYVVDETIAHIAESARKGETVKVRWADRAG